jgi:hypothetical protein
VLLQLLMPLLLLLLLLLLQETMKTGVILHRKHAIFFCKKTREEKKDLQPYCSTPSR